MPSVLILNGPNLNMLGRREPERYGTATLADLERRCREEASAIGLDVAFEQSNHEGALIDAIHAAPGRHHALVVNAGAYTHTSVALMDAVAAVGLPAVEVHLTNVHAREGFRHRSHLARACVGLVSGFGVASYTLALRAVASILEDAS